MPDSSNETMEVLTRREVEAALILLHGQGVAADDLTPLLTRLTRSREIGLHFLGPNAPVRRLSINEGRPQRAWYDVPAESVTDETAPEGLADSVARVEKLLSTEREGAIAPQRTVVGGFSQGGAVALHAGTAWKEPLAGIAVLAGDIVDLDGMIERASEAARQTPILMLHGSEDERIPPELARQAAERLREAGFKVTLSLSEGVDHSLSQQQVEELDHWLCQRLA